jgi:predicted double-glycine peptidase
MSYGLLSDMNGHALARITEAGLPRRASQAQPEMTLYPGSTVRFLQEIRQEGVIIQKWDTSCGEAALATVLTYSLNEPVSEREVASGMCT